MLFRAPCFFEMLKRLENCNINPVHLYMYFQPTLHLEFVILCIHVLSLLSLQLMFQTPIEVRTFLFYM